LQDNGLSINSVKCVFGKEEADYLGFTINSQVTKPLATRVQTIIKMKKPKDISGFRHFLGIINFYRRFTSNIASIQASIQRISDKHQIERQTFCNLERTQRKHF